MVAHTFGRKYEQKIDLILTAVRSLIPIVHLEKKTAVSIRSVFATTPTSILRFSVKEVLQLIFRSFQDILAQPPP